MAVAWVRLRAVGRPQAAATVAVAWGAARLVGLATQEPSSGWVGLAYGLGRIAPALRSPLLTASGLVVGRRVHGGHARPRCALAALGAALVAVRGLEHRRWTRGRRPAVALVANRDAGGLASSAEPAGHSGATHPSSWSGPSGQPSSRQRS